MPKYDFKCELCGLVKEATMLFKDTEAGIQCECEGNMERQFSPQGTVFQVRWGKPRVRSKVKRMQA